MNASSAFRVLGVAQSATREEIKAAYRKLAKEWHPDLHVHNKRAAEAKFKELQAALPTGAPSAPPTALQKRCGVVLQPEAS